MPYHFEVLMVEQMLDVATRSGKEIIDADNDRAISKQAFAQMRAEETGTAGNQYTFFEVHLTNPFTGLRHSGEP
jgi:hypothetical protein